MLSTPQTSQKYGHPEMTPNVHPTTQTNNSSISAETFAGNLRKITNEVHKIVENRPFMINLAQGRINKEHYRQYLIDLQLIYGAIEEILENNKTNPFLKPLCIPEIYRSSTIAKDLEYYTGYDPIPTEATKAFVKHIRELSADEKYLLIAVLYIRYLGDLFGGQMLYEQLVHVLGDDHTTFYKYTELMEKGFPVENNPEETKYITSLMQFAQMYREILNKLPLTEEMQIKVLIEAVRAFKYTDEMLLTIEADPNEKKGEIATILANLEEAVKNTNGKISASALLEVNKKTMAYLDNIHNNPGLMAFATH